MKLRLKSLYKHLLFWLIFWVIQSVLFSGGEYITGYLVKNIAIVSLQAGLVYFNFYLLWRLLEQGRYLLYALSAMISIYLVLAISKEAIGLSFSTFTPGIRYTIIQGKSWWPTDFWRILSGSAPYSLALLASTVYLLIKNRHQPKEDIASVEEENQENAENHTLMLKEGKVVHQLDVRDILFIQGMKEYVSWHTQDRKVITLHSLARLESELAPKGFMRTHKSYIVNTRQVNLVKYDALEIPGKRIPIGRSYRERVQNHFKSAL